MNYRELLGLASRAHGNIGFDPSRGVFRHKIQMGFLGSDWNPLINDGDAFRLAIKLDLFSSPHLYVSAGQIRSGCEIQNYRTAIVNAAAEIGSAMP